MVATTTNNDPTEKEKLSLSSTDKIMVANVIRKMANHNRLEILSLKNDLAKSAVATISKLFSKAAFEAVVWLSPIMRKTGARISSTIMAITYGESFLFKSNSLFDISKRFFTLPVRNMPIPAPKYKNAAINVGGIFSSNNFEKGVLRA